MNTTKSYHLCPAGYAAVALRLGRRAKKDWIWAEEHLEAASLANSIGYLEIAWHLLNGQTTRWNGWNVSLREVIVEYQDSFEQLVTNRLYYDTMLSTTMDSRKSSSLNCDDLEAYILRYFQKQKRRCSLTLL